MRDKTTHQEEFEDSVLNKLIAHHDADENFIFELVNHITLYMPNVVDNAIDYLTKKED